MRVRPKLVKNSDERRNHSQYIRNGWNSRNIQVVTNDDRVRTSRTRWRFSSLSAVCLQLHPEHVLNMELEKSELIIFERFTLLILIPSNYFSTSWRNSVKPRPTAHCAHRDVNTMHFWIFLTDDFTRKITVFFAITTESLYSTVDKWEPQVRQKHVTGVRQNRAEGINYEKVSRIKRYSFDGAVASIIQWR